MKDGGICSCVVETVLTHPDRFEISEYELIYVLSWLFNTLDNFVRRSVVLPVEETFNVHIRCYKDLMKIMI